MRLLLSGGKATLSAGDSSSKGRRAAMRMFAGLDVGFTRTAVCVLDEAGRIVWRGVVDTHPEALARRRRRSRHSGTPPAVMFLISRCTRSFTGHLNRGVDGVFEIVRIVGRGLVSIAEVHAIVAGAQVAQGEPEMARGRFGFLECHEYSKEMPQEYSVSSADCCEV